MRFFLLSAGKITQHTFYGTSKIATY